MARRSILSVQERQLLLAIPDNQAEFFRHYHLTDTDLSFINQHRGDANRLGFAILLCYMRYPGMILGVNQNPDPSLLVFTAHQLKVLPTNWENYSRREKTRREHLAQLQQTYGFNSFSRHNYQQYVTFLTQIAIDTDKGILLATELIAQFRAEKVLLPTPLVIDKICAEAITRANKIIYERLTADLNQTHLDKLDDLLQHKADTKFTYLGWLRQTPLKPSSTQMNCHIDRLKYYIAIDLPDGIERQIHQNRLLKIAREGGQMNPGNLAKFEPNRRYATLVALVLEGKATLIDEIIDLHDRIIGRIFNKTKNKHRQAFSDAGKAITDKFVLYDSVIRAVIEAKHNNLDPYSLIEQITSWDELEKSVEQAKALIQPNGFDFLPHITDSYQTFRRYAPDMLEILPLQATESADNLMQAVELLREMKSNDTRKLPKNPNKSIPTKFIKKRWHKLVHSDDGIDVRYYELCVLSELRNALRSGDIWVQGSRQFKAFDDYLIPSDRFQTLLQHKQLSINIDLDCQSYLNHRLELLAKQLKLTHKLAKTDRLPDATINNGGLKISPLEAVLSKSAQALVSQITRMLPRVKITEL